MQIIPKGSPEPQGHFVYAEELGWPDKHKYYEGLWNFYNTPGHSQYVTNTTGVDQAIINTVAIRVIRSWGYFEDSLMGLKNMFENMARIERDKQLWLDTTTTRAIWAATGPSLHEYMEVIRKGKEKGYFIACPDASLIHLLKANITPHMVFSTERGIETRDLLNNAIKEYDGNLLNKTWLNCGVYSDPGINWPGPRTWHFRKQSEIFYMFPELKKDQKQICWATPHVASPAWSWLINRGIKEIILVGQDLAYDDQGESHAKDSHKDDWIKSLPKYSTKSNDGSEVFTNSYWAEWALDLGNLIEDFKKKGFNFDVLNTAKKGLKIKNTYFVNGALQLRDDSKVNIIEMEGVKHTPYEEILDELKRYVPEQLGKKEIDEFYKTVPSMLFLAFPLTVKDYCMWQTERYRNRGKANIKTLQAYFRRAKDAIKEILTIAVKKAKIA